VLGRTLLRGLLSVGLCLSASACEKETPPPAVPVAGLVVESGKLSLYSNRRGRAVFLDAKDGSSLGTVKTRALMRGAWSDGRLVIGWDSPSATDLFGYEMDGSLPQWRAAGVKRDTIHWIDAAHVFAGKTLVDRRTGRPLVQYRVIIPTLSPDLVLACDDENRAYGVQPSTGSVYWQSGTCGVAVASSGKQWVRVLPKGLEVCSLSTGAAELRADLESRVARTEPAAGALPLVAMDAERVYVSTERGVEARRRKDGAKVWARDGGGRLAAGFGAVVALRGLELTILDGASGKPRLHRTLQGDPAAGVRLALSEGVLFVRTSRGVTALSLANGEEVWSKDVEG